MDKPVIAIDGPAASGKGTLARALARELGFAHMDTGALYRAVGLKLSLRGATPEDEGGAIAAAEELAHEIMQAENPSEILGSEDIRSDRAALAASKVAAIPGVRQALLALQQDFARSPPAAKNGAILDGRDVGTVICPEAPVKLFVTAETEIRAARRTKELQNRGIEVTYEAVLKDMQERDAQDRGRKTAPLKPAHDALVLDTGALSMEDMLERALIIIREKLGHR